MRLQSFLSRSGLASRRNVVKELEAGRVKVNGEVVRIPSYPIFPGKDKITYEGEEVKPSSDKIYYLFHKPKGVITTAQDTHGRKTVLHYFKHVKARLYPIGRLDQDTTGLLVLTNDGDLANKLMHPSFGVQKIYEALVTKELTKTDVEPLEKGIMIEDSKTAPCRIKILSVRDGKSKVEITLHEGRKRQIRVMFQSIGSEVIHLHRKIYGPLNLKGLAPGQSRLLQPEEIKLLEKSVAGNPRPKPEGR